MSVGGIQSALNLTTTKNPEVIGFPSKFLLELIKDENPAIDFEKTIMIYDENYAANFAFCEENNLDSLYVNPESGANDDSSKSKFI